MSILIERLRERARDPRRATDEDGGQARGNQPLAYATATETQIADAETKLGFRLPEILRQVYREVGNGGFGPGDGLPGVPTSAADTPRSVVGRYTALQQAQKRRAWPTGVLPLCEWGGDVASYVDCSLPESPVIRVDPNMPKADVGVRVPLPKRYDRAAQITDACWVESPSLETWLAAWADGEPLFYLAYRGADEEEEDESEEDGGDEDDAV